MTTHYSRAEWGGAAPLDRYLLDRKDVEGVALHWPAISRPLGNVEACKRALRSFQHYHMVDRGWSDIAYQIAVDQDGNSYGLRGLRYRSAANGDTATNLRFGAFLLLVATGEHPTPEMVATVRARCAAHRRLFPASTRIVGHDDIRPEPTACPGPLVGALIDAGKFGKMRG